MRTTKKILILGVALIMCLGLFTGCKNDYETNRIYVFIKEEYKDKFLTKEFIAEDFDWENFERIEYGTWHSNLEPERGWASIYLKEHGNKQVDDAIKHFESLDFVREAEKISTGKSGINKSGIKLVYKSKD